MLSSGMLRCVVWYKFTNVSEVFTASIIRAMSKPRARFQIWEPVGRGGANLNCTFQLWAIFSHPCAAYEQLKFCVQSLLDGLCKRAKFQVRFRPDQPDHFLVSCSVGKSVCHTFGYFLVCYLIVELLTVSCVFSQLLV
jgi:hypothetical protein